MAGRPKVTEQPEAVTEPENVEDGTGEQLAETAPPSPIGEDGIPVLTDPATAPAEPEPVEKTTRARKAKERREAFEVTRPDGVVVVVDRNIDTGEQTVTEK